MDIYKTLELKWEELLPEDLDFFETELACGDYDVYYRFKCLSKINDIRKARNFRGVKLTRKEQNEKRKAELKELEDIHKQLINEQKTVKKSGLLMSTNELKNPVIQNASEMQRDDTVSIIYLIKESRKSTNRLKEFCEITDNYLKKDLSLVEKYIGFFDAWEIDRIVTNVNLGESILEKFIGLFDKNRVSKYQKFSEEYFIKHFSELNLELVFKNKKNEWAKKGNLSKQLELFLRLKGIDINIYR